MLAKKQRSTKDILQIMKFPLLAIFLVSCVSLVSAAEKHNIRRQMSKFNNEDDVTLIDQDPHEIVGGDEVDPPFRYSFMVHGGGCGASLVAPNVLLTAAHCLDGSAFSQGVWIGKHNLLDNSEDSEFFFIEQAAPHALYSILGGKLTTS